MECEKAAWPDPRQFQRRAELFAEAEPKERYWTNQFDSPANRAAHYGSTGPEIWRQTHGQVAAFVAAG